jgi:hypothetical protein
MDFVHRRFLCLGISALLIVPGSASLLLPCRTSPPRAPRNAGGSGTRPVVAMLAGRPGTVRDPRSLAHGRGRDDRQRVYLCMDATLRGEPAAVAA